MKRAIVGVWLNYGSTLIFTVIFAEKFGGMSSAGIYVLALSLATAIGGVFTAGAETLVTPRIRATATTISSDGLVLLAALGAAALAVLAIAFIGADFIVGLAHQMLGGQAASAPVTFRLALLFSGLQVTCGGLTSIVIAFGSRFVPAAAPVLPSLGGIIYLLLKSSPSVEQLFSSMSLGSVGEIIILLIGTHFPRHISRTTPAKSNHKLSFVTLLQYIGLAIEPLIERTVAGWRGITGAAYYNYAMKSLTVGEELLVGGPAMALLGDWSQHNVKAEDVKRQFQDRLSKSALILTIAACTGVVYAVPLVSLVYQRGQFTFNDSLEVAKVVRYASFGFLQEGVGMIITQRLVSARYTWDSVAIGYANVVLRICLAIGLGIPFGVLGVAAAYSLSMGPVLLLQLLRAWKRQLLRFPKNFSLFAVILAGSLTTCVLVGERESALERGILLLAVTAAAIVGWLLQTERHDRRS